MQRLTSGFTGRVVDELDRPLAGALVVVTDSVGAHRRRAGAPTESTGGAAAASLIAARAASGPARLLAGPSGPDPASWAVVASTEADGRFALPVLPPGRYILFALHGGPLPAASKAVSLDGGGFLTVPLRLVVFRSRSLL